MGRWNIQEILDSDDIQTYFEQVTVDSAEISHHFAFGTRHASLYLTPVAGTNLLSEQVS